MSAAASRGGAGRFWCCAALLACSTAASANAPSHVDHPARGAKARPVAVETEVQALVRRHAAAQRVVLTEQLCLLKRGCATDEGRLLDAMAAVKQVSQALADRAHAGDSEAAYQRGLIGLAAAETHSKRSWAETDAQFPGTTAVLRRRWAQETASAESFLSLAAAAGHASACLTLADHLAARVPQPEPVLVSRLFRCAVNGFSAQGQREAAIGAFVKMREAGGPGDPLLVEAHSMIYRDKPPERAWRQVEPAQALELRNKAAP